MFISSQNLSSIYQSDLSNPEPDFRSIAINQKIAHRAQLNRSKVFRNKIRIIPKDTKETLDSIKRTLIITTNLKMYQIDYVLKQILDLTKLTPVTGLRFNKINVRKVHIVFISHQKKKIRLIY